MSESWQNAVASFTGTAFPTYLRCSFTAPPELEVLGKGLKHGHSHRLIQRYLGSPLLSSLVDDPTRIVDDGLLGFKTTARKTD